MKTTGRPRGLTPEVGLKVCQLVSEGMHQDLAARAAGVCPRSIYQWLERGREETCGIYYEFVMAFELAKGATHNGITLRQAMDTGPTLMIRWLEERLNLARWRSDQGQVSRFAVMLINLAQKLTQGKPDGTEESTAQARTTPGPGTDSGVGTRTGL